LLIAVVSSFRFVLIDVCQLVVDLNGGRSIFPSRSAFLARSQPASRSSALVLFRDDEHRPLMDSIKMFGADAAFLQIPLLEVNTTPSRRPS
jgi:hypothetical protein